MIKAIETVYRGYRFRSRLEARWAVFFERLGMNWEYEPEGFELPSGDWYLPDFRITAHGVTFWVEVKPRHIGSDPKFDEFTKSSHYAVLVSGDPYDALMGCRICPRCGIFHKEMTVTGNLVISKEDGIYDEVCFLCDPCDFDTPFGGDHETQHDGVMGTPYHPHKGWIVCREGDYIKLVQRYVEAARSARAARFEHGETPA